MRRVCQSCAETAPSRRARRAPQSRTPRATRRTAAEGTAGEQNGAGPIEAIHRIEDLLRQRDLGLFVISAEGNRQIDGGQFVTGIVRAPVGDYCGTAQLCGYIGARAHLVGYGVETGGSGAGVRACVALGQLHSTPDLVFAVTYADAITLIVGIHGQDGEV